MSSLAPPEHGWWKPFPKDERVWLVLVVIAALIFSIITVGWVFAGPQNVPISTYRTTPEAFEKQVQEFIAKYQTDAGEVRVPPGQDAFVMGRMWSWGPTLRLKAGQQYTIWISAKDVLHGFSIAQENLNVMAVPGHAYGVRLTPLKPGEYLIVCNEYCGVGHQSMMGKIIVEE
jgi:cytochrome c oxidase subunit 2